MNSERDAMRMELIGTNDRCDVYRCYVCSLLNAQTLFGFSGHARGQKVEGTYDAYFSRRN